MAFATTNKGFWTGLNMGVPIAHTESADNTGAIASYDAGVAGLKWVRGRIRVKGFGADNTHCSFVVKVSSAAAMTTPEVVFSSANHVATSSNDVGLNVDFIGWSNAGFRYISVTPTTATGAITYDIMLDCG